MSDTRTPKTITPPRTPDASQGMTLFVMIVATLYFGKEVLLPVTLALLLAFILAPLVDLLRRAYLGRIPSVLLGVILAVGVILGVGGVIGSQIGELSVDMPNYVATMDTKFATAKHYTIGELSKLAKSIGNHSDGTPTLALPSLQATPPQTKTSAATQPAVSSGSLDLAQHYLSTVLTPLGNLGIVFMVAVFALLQREDLRDRLIRLLGSDDLHRTTLAIDDAGRRLSRYFVTQLCVNATFGVVIAIGLYFIGVPNPILWGILSGLLRFVPYVGLIISAILPVALAAAVQPGWSMMLSTMVFYALMELATGQVVEPLLYGRNTGLSPFSVVVAAIFWSWLWGLTGLILSTPLTLCLVVLGRHIKRLEFLDIMLGDRSPLTPVESFYQRVLAGDADEAQDLAEKLLKEHSLSTYYDEVAIKGMQLAAHDAARDTLDPLQIERIKNTVKLLINGLDKHVDKLPAPPAPDEGPVGGDVGDQALSRQHIPHSISLSPHQVEPQWQNPSAILCIAGRGPFDESPTSMLLQLLGKHGLSGHMVAYSEVARDQINALDITGVAIACVSYLDVSGNPAHLRYLIQRLRQKLPAGTPILVGVWPPHDQALSDANTQTLIGADYYTSSLGQAVTICTELARAKTHSSVIDLTNAAAKNYNRNYDVPAFLQ